MRRADEWGPRVERQSDCTKVTGKPASIHTRFRRPSSLRVNVFRFVEKGGLVEQSPHLKSTRELLPQLAADKLGEHSGARLLILPGGKERPHSVALHAPHGSSDSGEPDARRTSIAEDDALIPISRRAGLVRTQAACHR